MSLTFNRIRTGLMAATITLTLLGATSHAAIATIPGLTTVRFWESTGGMNQYNFAFNSPQMNTQLGLGFLTPTSFDFAPLVDENYDVFYSNANGTFNPLGNYVTVEGVFPHPLPSGGGLNLGAVDLIVSGSPVRADILVSWVGLGNNFLPGSVGLAVDADNFPLAPVTATTMGSTVVPPAQHLRVTVTWSQYIPEPNSLALGGIGLLGMLVRRKK
jgi:hypothetical protein